jgi:hypothetical protein
MALDVVAITISAIGDIGALADVRFARQKRSVVSGLVGNA